MKRRELLKGLPSAALLSTTTVATSATAAFTKTPERPSARAARLFAEFVEAAKEADPTIDQIWAQTDLRTGSIISMRATFRSPVPFDGEGVYLVQAAPNEQPREQYVIAYDGGPESNEMYRLFEVRENQPWGVSILHDARQVKFFRKIGEAV